MQLVLQPCGDSDARQHFVDTIERPVSISRISPFLSDSERRLVESTFGAAVAVWGVTPAIDGSNAKAWERMDLGDTVLLYRAGKFFFRGVVAYKTRNERLAVDLWSRKADGSTWEYVFFLSDLEPIDIDIAVFNRAASYAPNFVVQRYMVLPESKSEHLLDALDLADATGARALSDSDVADAEKKLSQLEDELDSPSMGRRRREQALLRDVLLSGRANNACAICGRTLPVDLLCVGHIKPRHSCSPAERKNLRNLMAVCLLGCDRLFEAGYLHVDGSGSVVVTADRELSDDLTITLKSLVGRRCSAWSSESEGFYRWHRTHLKPFI
jgi:hypothetical protein